jgi:hypothetical protein
VPFASKQFTQTAKAEIEIGLGLRYRHDLTTEQGGWMRRWKGLALVEAGGVGTVKNESCKSDEALSLAS